MKGWKLRRASVVGVTAISALVALVLLVVLPAFGATGQRILPASQPLGVVPLEVDTGGQSNDCAVFYAANPSVKPAYQYRIDNPKTGVYTTTITGTKVSFRIQMNPPNTSPGLSITPREA